LRGFVAAWLVHQTGQYPSPSGLVVFPTQPLNVRVRPSTEANILTVVSPGDSLTVLGERGRLEDSIGQMDHWLNVRTPGKFVGYVAAWFVSTSSSAPPTPQSASVLTVFPMADINLRAQPSVNSPRVNGVFRAEPLLVIEADQTEAQDKIGKEGLWIYVQKKDGNRGWAAAWLLSTKPV
jgi:hypothetical protein